MPSVDFCSCVDPRAQPPTLRTPPAFSPRPKPRHRGWRDSLAGLTSQTVPGQGSHAPFFSLRAAPALVAPFERDQPCGRSRDPRISVRGADTDLPQPDNDPDTPCRLLVRAEPGKSVSACDRAEHPRVKNDGMLLRSLTWRASSPTRGAEAPRAFRAASPGHPRKRPSSANPRCLPPERPVAFRLRREPWILSSRVGYLLQPESLCTFVSAGGRQPGRAVVPSARPPVSGTSH